MAARAVAAARRVVNLTSGGISTAPKSSTVLIQRRGLASGGGDNHGPPKVNFWQDPLSPSKWKEEHFVIVSLTGWGLLFYGGYKYFTRGSKDNEQEKVREGTH